MELLTSYPSNILNMLSKNSRISSSDIAILQSPFPADFPNGTEVAKLKNSKISKKTFDLTHFMNFQRAVNNIVEYRNSEFHEKLYMVLSATFLKSVAVLCQTLEKCCARF